MRSGKGAVTGDMAIKLSCCGALLIGLVLTLAACGGEGVATGATWAGTVDTVEGVRVVSSPAEPLLSAAESWRLEEQLSIGVVEGDPDYQFGGIAAVEVDAKGNIYVADQQARRVAIYDSTGVFQLAFGRQGEGPGEFEAPNRLLWKGDTLVAWDPRLLRLSYFDRQGNLLRDERAELQTYNRLALRPDGMFWVQRGPMYYWPIRPGVGGIGHIVVADVAEESADTVLSWEDQSTIPVRFENGLTVVPRRYAPRTQWTTDAEGRLFVAAGDEYEIDVYDMDGERIAAIRREHTRQPPSAAERDSALAWLEENAERYGPNADKVRKAFEIAELKSATGELLISDDGYLWVRVFDEDVLAKQTWDVFDPEWRYLTSVTLPPTLEVHRVTRDKLYGEMED
ncbi:MAG: hypothetical protein JSU87_10985, partial [Gemmatimonadota bacterium]